MLRLLTRWILFATRWLKRLLICSILLGFVVYATMFTPVFSTAGLWLLSQLPVPSVLPSPPVDLDSDFAINLHKSAISPTVYVVLGGGLTHADHDNEATDNEQGDAHNPIILNAYSLKRVETAKFAYQTQPLPIILTGVEAAWMRDWLNEQGIYQLILENASMNTCENARFTAKRLEVSHAYLVTDAYHMSRARRQFAMNGIATTPMPAPLPHAKHWLKPSANMAHSRRTLYELVAYARDVFRPQSNCREADTVRFETLLESRQPKAVKTF